LVEKKNKRFCQSALNKKVGKILYGKYKLNAQRTLNKTIKKRIYSFNSKLSRRLTHPTHYLSGYGYIYRNFELTLEWSQRERKHAKYREQHYSHYENKEVFKEITEEIGDIFYWNHGEVIKYNCLKVIEYENEYGELIKNALIKDEYGVCETEYFSSKKEVEQSFKKLIEKNKTELKSIQNNYSKFKKKINIYNK